MFELKVATSSRHDSRSWVQTTDTRATLQEKAKRKAWENLVHEKVKPEDAQKRYVALVIEMKKQYGYNG